MEEKDLESRRNFIRKSAIAGAALTFSGLGATQSLGKTPHAEKADYALKERTAKKAISLNFDFENGNLGTHRIEGDTIFVGPVSRHKDTWFSFKIKGVKHRKVTMIIDWINTAKVTGNFGGQVNNTAMITYDGNGFEVVKDSRFELKKCGGCRWQFHSDHHTHFPGRR